MTFLNFTPIRHQEFVNNLCSELQYGFRVGYKGKRFPRVAANLPFATQQPEVIEANLLEEVRLGRVAGLFKSLPFKNFQIHPLDWSIRREPEMENCLSLILPQRVFGKPEC